MSWIEVECKIKVSNHSEIRERIKKLAKFVKRERKVDQYYAFETPSGVFPNRKLRIRDAGKKKIVNFKRGISYKNGIWAKNEVEFEVSDIKNFFNLLDNFGFTKWLGKEKVTETYKTKDNVNIELNNVKGLGWFIEIEILCEKDITTARRKIAEIRKKLGFSSKDAEKRGYTKVLWEKRN